MHQNTKLKVRVRSINDETSTVKRFTFQAIDESTFPLFSGGSHITISLPHSAGTLERHYSIFNLDSEKGLFEIAVRLAQDSSGGSLFLHEKVRVDDILTVSYPKNYFPLSFQAKHHVFYAAGIGITPFLSMMAELTEKNASFELHYAAKSKEQCAFYDYLNEVYRDRCFFYFSKSESSKRLLPTQLLNHRIGTHVYFCGPEAMLQDFTVAAKAYGYPPFNIHVERFAAPQKKEHEEFQIKLQRSDVVLEVPANSSILDVLLQHGINVPYSCRVGGCGSCELKVVDGQIVHFDSFFTEEQKTSQQRILCCVSRGKGILRLDI